MLLCLPLSLALIRWLLTGSHSNSDLSIPFLRITGNSLVMLVVFTPQIKHCFSGCRCLSSWSSPPALAHPQNVQLVWLNFCNDLSELTSLVHGANIPESNPGLSFGAQDFHLPVSSFLSAFTAAIHTSLYRLWKAIPHSCSWCFCYCFHNSIFFFTVPGCLPWAKPPCLEDWDACFIWPLPQAPVQLGWTC